MDFDDDAELKVSLSDWNWPGQNVKVTAGIVAFELRLSDPSPVSKHSTRQRLYVCCCIWYRNKAEFRTYPSSQQQTWEEKPCNNEIKSQLSFESFLSHLLLVSPI